MVERIAVCLVVLGLATGGCVDFGLPASGGSNGGNLPDDSDGANGIPAVRLNVSNPNPIIGEEVLLTCTLVAGDPAGVRFGFQPASAPLLVNAQAGTASYIVDQSELGVELVVTCTATNAYGTSAPSNQQVVIAGGP